MSTPPKPGHPETARTYPRQARAPFNVPGHPALAMMSGLSRNGLPVSVQFVGRYFEDANEAGPHLPGVRRGVADYALDPKKADRLWELSAAMLAG